MVLGPHVKQFDKNLVPRMRHKMANGGIDLPDTFAHKSINSTQMARRRQDSKAGESQLFRFQGGSISSFLPDLELLANGASGVKSFPNVSYC